MGQYDFTFLRNFGFLFFHHIHQYRQLAAAAKMKIEPKRKIVRFVRSRGWGAVIPNEMAEEIKTHFLSFRIRQAYLALEMSLKGKKKKWKMNT